MDLMEFVGKGPRGCSPTEARLRALVGELQREVRLVRANALVQSVPPDGWVLMPLILTEEMLQAGYPAGDAQEGYEAMVAARPEVP